MKISLSEASRLKTIMDRNIFSEGVTLANGYLPAEARKNRLFRLHFHVGEDYIPASSFDIDFAANLPFVVCAYSMANNRTEVSLLYKEFEEETTPVAQTEDRSFSGGREIKQIVGYYDNNEMIPVLARPYLGKPEMSIKRLSEHEYAITCKTQAPPLQLEVWEVKDQTGIYRGAMKGTDSGDLDPPDRWRDYTKLDPVTFQVKFRTPKDSKNPIFYFFNQDYIGASAYCDEQI
jgi:hypothetical protein